MIRKRGLVVLLVLAGFTLLFLIYARETSCNWGETPGPVHGEKVCSTVVW